MRRLGQFGFNGLAKACRTERLEQEQDQIFKRLIGVGRGSNIQQNGLVQVLVLVQAPRHAEVWQRVRDREPDAIVQVVMKPPVPYDAAGTEVRLP